MIKFKPVYLSYDPRVPPAFAAAAAAVIEEVLDIAGVADRIPFADVGTGESPYSPAGYVIPQVSVDLLLRACAHPALPHALAGRTLSLELLKRRWQEIEPHYDVLLVQSEMFSKSSSSQGIHSFLGVSTCGFNAVLSLSHFSGLPERDRYELMKTALLQEVGRMFGLNPNKKKHGIIHCTHICVMRAVQSPLDLECYTDDRLEGGPFCLKCFEKLCAFFV